MITHVAIKDRKGKVWSLPKPNRHGHVIHLIHEETGDRKIAMHLLGDHVQGFVNDAGLFLTRMEAWYEARHCNQILPPYNPTNTSQRLEKAVIETIPRELFSEDLW